MPKMLNLWFFLKYMYFSVYAQFFFLASILHLHFRLQTGIATSLSVIEQYFFAVVRYMFWHCAHKILWPFMKNYGPTELQSLPFFAEKACFWYPAFECCWGPNFSSRITKFCLHNLNAYTYPQKKNCFAIAHPGRWQFQFEVRSDFPQGVHFVRF